MINADNGSNNKKFSHHENLSYKSKNIAHLVTAVKIEKQDNFLQKIEFPSAGWQSAKYKYAPDSDSRKNKKAQLL